MKGLLRRLDAAVDRALLGPIEYAPIYSRQRTPGTPVALVDPPCAGATGHTIGGAA